MDLKNILPSPTEFFHTFPLHDQQRHFIALSRQEIAEIFEQRDSRLLFIVGPCSAHDEESMKEYAKKLKMLSQQVSDRLLLVMRVHVEKPRTSLGWKGMLYDPFLDGSHDIKSGLSLSRKLLLDLAELEIPTATEFLDPLVSCYLQDLISWGSIGARTTTSQIHRQMASGLPMAVGFKNGTDGNVDIAVNAALSASTPHSYLSVSNEGQLCVVQSRGNRYAHVVLRGGEKQPNYDPASLENVRQRLKKNNLPLRLMVDCSHDNSNKCYDRQPLVFQSVMNQILEGNKTIMGMILESHLHEGSQFLDVSRPSSLKYGISVTDACIDWNTTEKLISWAYTKVRELFSNEQKLSLSPASFGNECLQEV